MGIASVDFADEKIPVTNKPYVDSVFGVSPAQSNNQLGVKIDTQPAAEPWHDFALQFRMLLALAIGCSLTLCLLPMARQRDETPARETS